MIDHRNGRPPYSQDSDLRRTFGLDSRLDDQTVDLIGNLIANVMFLRGQTRRGEIDPRKGINDECGYPDDHPTIEQYQDLYDREPIAARVVEVLPKESWQVQPLVYESEDQDQVTPFELAWDALGSQLATGPSWHVQEQGSSIWSTLEQADVVSGIGRYGVLLLGFNDGLPLREPVAGVLEKNSIPAGKDRAGNTVKGRSRGGHYSLSVNAERAKGRRINFLRPYSEYLSQVLQWETNLFSPRFGQPVRYLLTMHDPREQSFGAGVPASTQEVHWTRVIHIPSDGTAVPRMRPVFNRLCDLRKIYSADGEGFWKSVIAEMFLETHPELGGDVEVDLAGLRSKLENMKNGLQRWAQLTGMSAKTLPPQMLDPTPHVQIHLDAICILLGIPKRVFMGSERGELASSQDGKAWNKRLRRRQHTVITPTIITPLIDRLILTGVLPEPGASGRYMEGNSGQALNPLRNRLTVVRNADGSTSIRVGGYCVEWPDLDAQSATEKADVAVKRTTAIATYVQSGAQAMIPEMEFLTHILGMPDEEARAILDAAMAKAEEEAGGEPDVRSPLLATVGGMTGTVDFFRAAKEGAISEDQLKQLLMLFFKLTEEQADAVIADGMPPAEEAAEAVPPGAPFEG